MKLHLQKARDFIAWCLVMYGPSLCINPYTAFGHWCLSTAGNWAYRGYSAS